MNAGVKKNSMSTRTTGLENKFVIECKNEVINIQTEISVWMFITSFLHSITNLFSSPVVLVLIEFFFTPAFIPYTLSIGRTGTDGTM